MEWETGDWQWDSCAPYSTRSLGWPVCLGNGWVPPEDFLEELMDEICLGLPCILQLQQNSSHCCI